MFLGWRIVDMLGLSNFACHPRSLHRVRAQFVLADGARLTIEGNIIGRDDELNLVVDRAVELDILGRTSELGRIMLAGNAYITFSGLFKIA